MLSPYLILSLVLVYTVECYDEKFDKVDVDKVINDEALFNSYLNCLLDKGPCTAELAPEFKGIPEFKELLPEILSNACAKCSKLQKNNVRKLFKVIYEKKTDVLAEFEKKYDPKSEYKANFLSLVESQDD